MSRPIHYQHYVSGIYFHTYCGLINFKGYRDWPFTKTAKTVTCKSCIARIRNDKRVLSYRARLAMWETRKGETPRVARKPAA